jgi:hypothetical protein
MRNTRVAASGAEQMTSTNSPPAGISGEAITLRICGGERDGQIVRLTSEKCSIGARPGCTLRLRRRGVQPVHCLLLRGPGGVFVRRWSPDTLLNGRTFLDAPLSPADRLRCGPIEFELVGEPEPSKRETAAPSDTASAQRESAELDAERLALQRQRDEWLAERKDADEQLAELTARVERQLNDLRARQDAVRLEQQQWQVEMAAARTAADEQRLAAEREQQARWTRQEHLLAERLREFETSRNAFESTHLSFEIERKQWEEHRRQAEQELAALHQALDRDRRELESMHAQWDAQRQQVESHWAENQVEVDQQRAEIEAQKLVLRAQHDAMVEHRRHDPWEEPMRTCRPAHDATPDDPAYSSPGIAADDPTAHAPSDDEVFARLRAMSLLKDEGPHDQWPESATGEPPAALQEAVPELEPASPVATSDDSEPSIEEYMSALMNRVGGNSARSGASARAESSKPGPEPESPIAAAQPDAAEQPPAAEPVRAPRKQVFERPTDLAAMRELANFSLKTALSSHSTRRSAMRALGKAFISVFAFVTAFVAWSFAAPDSAVAQFALPSSILLGILFAVHSVTMALRISRGQLAAKKAATKPNSAEATDREHPAPPNA